MFMHSVYASELSGQVMWTAESTQPSGNEKNQIEL